MTSGIWLIIVLLLILLFFWRFFPTSMYITAQFAGTPISFGEMLGMRLRKIDSVIVVNAYIMLRKAQIEVKLRELETAYLLNLNLENIYSGMIYAKKNNIPLTLEQAKAADKKGTKIVDELRKSLES